METESLEHYLNRHHSKQTARGYYTTLKHFLAAHPKAKNYQYIDIVSYFNELAIRYPNINTRVAKLSCIKRYYDYLIESRQRNDHPCRFFKIKGTSQMRNQVQFQDLFTASELEKLLDRDSMESQKLRNKITISFLIYQALTVEEISKLDLDNIDLDSYTVYIKSSNVLSGRTLELKHIQREYIAEYVRTYRLTTIRVETNRLLISYHGHPVTVDSIIRMLEPLKSLYPERNLHAITIRQSVIANWVNKSKFPIEQVQIWAGYKLPSSVLKFRRKDAAEQQIKINKWHPLK